MRNAVEIGDLGEEMFRQLLESKSKYLGFYFLSDVCLPRGGKVSTQIDFLVFSEKGYYCIEVKNWKGTLTVDDSKRYLFVRYTGQPLRVPNPMVQNNIHVRTLYEDTGYSFENRVVLTGNKTGESKFVKTIDEFFDELTNGEVVYSEEEVKRTFNKFKTMKEDSFLDSYSRDVFIDYQIESKQNKAVLKKRRNY